MSVHARSTVNALVAAVVAFAISILCFMVLAQMPLASAALIGVGLAVMTFALAFLGQFLVHRAREARTGASPRE